MVMMVAPFVMILTELVGADIPVHCLRSDIAGHWMLHMGHAVKRGESTDQVPDFADGGIARDYCFSGHPNKNEGNVKLDIEKMMSKDEAARTIKLELTLDVAVNPDLTEHMLARSPEFTSNEDHTWTTAYDEGWEVRMRDGNIPYRFFALAKYNCADPTSSSCGQNGAGESDEGLTKGYMSHCGQVLVGWYMKGDEKGCFWGSKTDTKERDRVHSFVMEDSREYDDPRMKVRTAYHHQDFDEFVFPSVLELHKDGSHAEGFTTVRRPGSIKRFNSESPQAKDHLHVRDECYGNDISDEDKISALEKEHPIFDWRDYQSNKWNSEPLDQGACGSCYSIAMTYVLQSRTNIALFKAAEKAGKPMPTPVDLSSHSVLSCSYYNQGCEGGYPYLVAKHAMEFGIPKESCMPYGSAGQGHVQECNGECFKSEDQVVFAKDYNYVGGFYGVCGQNRLMQSIKEWGPVVVAIEVPTPFQGAGGGRIVGESYLTKKGHHNLRSFRFDEGGGLTDLEPHFPEEHHRQDPSPNAKLLEAKWYLAEGCNSVVSLDDLSSAMNEALPENSFVRRNGTRFAIDSDNFPADGHPYAEAKKALSSSLKVSPECVKLQMADGTINGWEYTNHAITVVGWGEHQVPGKNGEQETRKYWIIRNSWGSFYGDNGYAYVARGINYAGIESQAVEIIPDTKRGLLASMLQDMGVQSDSEGHLGGSSEVAA
jgi:cathepsin C